MAKNYEKIENLILLENGLEHIQFELNKAQPLFFRIGKEAHLFLYRSMVEALRGTANLEITGRPISKSRIVKYRIGDEPWLQVEKTKVDGCRHAWRYGDPVPTLEPDDDGKPFDISEVSDYLQIFYDLLAKIQATSYMSKYVGSKPIRVPDNEMLVLEWLHENIRNEFEHFIPKLYGVSISDLISASVICLSLSFKLFESGNMTFYSDSSTIKNALERCVGLLKQRQSDYVPRTNP